MAAPTRPTKPARAAQSKRATPEPAQPKLISPTATAMPMDLPRFFPGSIAVPASRRTSMISSVAYATDDIASEENTARATVFESRSCRAWARGMGAPTITRFRMLISMLA